MKQVAHAGRRGEEIRSDCWIEIEMQEEGGMEIEIRSKVAALYGRSIRTLLASILNFYGIFHARVSCEDAGALPFVIAARAESAIKRLNGREMREYLLPRRDHSMFPTARERLRRTRLYLPGNEPKFFLNAGLHAPDGIILDLEDSVSPSVKDEARLLVRNALREVDFRGSERMVRINQLPLGYDDLHAVIPQTPHVVLIPKCEEPDQVRSIDERITEIRKEHDVPSDIYLVPIIESAKGSIRSYDIATATPTVVGLAVGLEDYTVDIGTQRTMEGKESFWMRSQIVNAARAAGIQPIDTVFSDVGDMEGLRASVLEAKSLGFDGKGCIHPRQIPVVHEAFSPAVVEVDRAKEIVRAFEEAEALGLGVVALGSKMIDPPVVKRALRTIELAIQSGRLEPEWREKAHD